MAIASANMRGTTLGPRSQRGQSLPEVAICCIAIVPLFLGVWLLGQYIHVRSTAMQAARASAWDAAVSPHIVATTGGMPSTDTAQTRIRALQFGKTDASLKNVTTANTLADPMLKTFAGKDLLLSNKVTLNTYTNSASPAYSEKVLAAIGKVTKTIGLGEFPPDNNGLITAEVHARTEHITTTSGSAAKFLDPLDSMNLDFPGRTVLLADTWNAAGNGENARGDSTSTDKRMVRTVIRPLVPSDALGTTFDGAITDIVDILGKIPFIDDIITPGFDQFVFGKTAPDVVPADKMVPYGKKP